MSVVLAKFKLVVIGVFVFVAGGCAIVPETITISDDAVLSEFSTVKGQASVQQGSVARWGGEIIAIENLKDYSEIELLYYPANHYGKPISTKTSEGRFKARVNGFIDPLVFEKGRLITLVGEVVDPSQGMIGEQAYLYPTLAAEGFHMWKRTKDVEVEHFHFAPFGHSWGSPFFFNPRWRHHGFRNYNTRHRVKLKDAKSGVVTQRSEPANTQRVVSSRSGESVRAPTLRNHEIKQER